jgi:hypothetical protein
MADAIQIICVKNNDVVFRSMIGENSHMNRYPITVYDNAQENIGIPKRYNDFIEHRMQDDAWLVFCHQDFGFSEDPGPRLAGLSREQIYGPIGAARKKGLYIRSGRVVFEKKVLLGQIRQARGDAQFFDHGIRLTHPMQVDTVDCCCLIVHASLVGKHGLRFDEHLDFHLYAEEFSLNAWRSHRVRTMAVQMEARHLSFGDTSQDFHRSLDYVRAKYPGQRFAGTCF